ncbi:GatB/YqeY domain-containing protein [Microthyrium microscopicum]|uniref:Altered inheritance of mitochondria protein 41 n=1 Tax=Microthyrium microscopicum TaxID=703497 RepID=A0A6A6UH10_9PEZI|nr:GatB/YqeY domain-containing protein [Microthyrium microscopicum]
MVSRAHVLYRHTLCSLITFRLCQLPRASRQTIWSKSSYSTSTNAPPSTLLSRLRDDLKTAMRARDKPRLTVLRAILADITNSSKTAAPVNDDLALLALIKKKMGTTRQSIQEFYEADRKDLVAKEEEELNILEGYAGDIKVMTEHEVRAVVQKVVDELSASGHKVNIGEVMKACTRPDGAFEGHMVEKSLIAKVVKEVVETKTSSK